VQSRQPIVEQPQASDKATLQIIAPPQVSVGQQFVLVVKANNIKDLAGAPFTLSYDPKLVEYIYASEGGFLKSDGKPTVFSGKAVPANGLVNITHSRSTGTGGLSGSGALVSMLFRSKNQGSANFGFSGIKFVGSDGKPLAVLPFSTVVEIR